MTTLPDLDHMRGWKAVPIPPAIARLPREAKRGFPIPYVAEWNPSAGERSRNDWDWSNPRRPKMGCSCRIGYDYGTPDLGHQCPVRQRRCMSQRVCQVCGRKIRPTTLMGFLNAMDANVMTEPGMHLDCAEYSARVCPGIRKRDNYGIHVTREYHLLDQFMVGLAEDGTPRDEFFEHGQTPAPMQTPSGLKPAVLSFHGAMPYNGFKQPISLWLDDRARERGERP